MFIQGTTQQLPGILEALSHPRLSSYRRFFKASTDAEAIGLYQWNEELSGALFRAVSLVEIVLRNQFHRALSTSYGVSGSTTSRDWYQHLTLNATSSKKIREVLSYKSRGTWLPKVPVPSPDDVVSKLTFGFWPHLLDVARDSAGGSVPWGALLLQILPGHRQRQASYWNKQSHQDALFARLDLCNELRNRIAHHEPVWKLGPLMDEARARPGRPLSQVAPAPSTPADALARLRLIYDRLIELLGWLSPSVAKAYAGGEIDARCNMLLAAKTLAHFQARRLPAEIDLAKLIGKRELRKVMKYASRNRQPIHFRDGLISLGHWSCPIK